MDKNYNISQKYENYILLAYNSINNLKNGADYNLMRNLLVHEETGSKLLGISKNKLTDNIKRYMTRATKKAITRRLEKADKEKLKSFLPAIQDTESALELVSICKEGVDILGKYKPHSS